MIHKQNTKRFLASLLATSILTAPCAGWTQPGPAPSPQGDQQVNVPERVGRLARIKGQVSYHESDATQWSSATQNYPVSMGDSFWTQPDAEAEMEVSASRMALNSGTEFDLTTLDYQQMAAVEPQGELYLGLHRLASGETWSVQTPRGLVTIRGDGRYDIVAGDTDHPTIITVAEGAADITGDNLNLHVAAGQAGIVQGSDSFTGQVQQAQRIAFLDAMIAEEQPRQPVSGGVATPAAVEQIPGGSDLAQYGAWQSAPEYGQVWYPQVASGWAPYRDGHWVYIAPWGWTWQDNAPWGFAPFHYGRWVDVDGRWGWVAGGGGEEVGYERPCYAPALVAFVGAGLAVGAGVAIGAALSGGGSVGWVPLGWHEPYYPAFNAGPNYIRNVNINHVTNVTQIVNNYNNHNTNIQINNYRNFGRAATVVPASALANSQPVAAVARPLAAAQAAQFRPIVARQPVAPTARTAGVTPGIAQRIGIPGGAAAVEAAHRTAPGPAIGPAGIPPQQRAQSVLRGPAGAAPGTLPGTTGARPGQPAPGGTLVPGAPPHPGEPGRPPLAAPGAGNEPSHPGAPTAGAPPRPGEPARPPLATPGTRNEPARPGAPGPTIVPHQGEPGRPGEPARPPLAAPGAGAEPGRPGAPVGPRPAEPSRAAEPQRPAEPNRPSEPSRPVEPARPPQAERPAVEPGRPPEPAHPVEPPRGAQPRPPAPAQAERPAPAPQPPHAAAPPPHPAPPLPRPAAPPPRPAPPPPRPAPPPPRPAPAAHPAPAKEEPKRS